MWSHKALNVIYLKCLNAGRNGDAICYSFLALNLTKLYYYLIIIIIIIIIIITITIIIIIHDICIVLF